MLFDQLCIFTFITLSYQKYAILLIRVAPEHMNRCLHLDIGSRIFLSAMYCFSSRMFLPTIFCSSSRSFSNTMTSLLTRAMCNHLGKTRLLADHCSVGPNYCTSSTSRKWGAHVLRYSRHARSNFLLVKIKCKDHLLHEHA